MSPPGISYFYGGLDAETSLAELRGKPGEHATVAQWVTARDSYVVDLDRVGEVPSLFDADRARARSSVLFLRRFADEIRKPVLAGDNAAVDYVPTQAVAEYIRHVMRGDRGDRIGGVLYRSAARPAGVNIVIFPTDPELTRMVGPPVTFEFDDASGWSSI